MKKSKEVTINKLKGLMDKHRVEGMKEYYNNKEVAYLVSDIYGFAGLFIDNEDPLKVVNQLIYGGGTNVINLTNKAQTRRNWESKYGKALYEAYPTIKE